MTVDPGAGSPMSERMQALLSRAVEDQLSEQRQLATAIAEFRGQLGRLAQELEQLRLPSAEVGAPVQASIDAVANELRTSVRLLGERLDDVQTGVAQVREAVAAVTGGLGSLPSFGDRVAALQQVVASAEERLQSLTGLRDAVGLVQQRVDGVDVDVREMRGAFAGIAARVADLPGRADIDAMIGRAAAPAQGATDRLAALESTLDELAGQVGELVTSLREQRDRGADGLGAGPAAEADGALAARLDALEAGIAAIRERLDAGPVSGASPGDGRLDEVLDAVRDLHERIAGEDGLEAQLAELAAPPEDEDEAEGEAAAEIDDDRLAEAVREAVRTEVAETERRLADHVDEAVLALAEALLRRRAPRTPPVRTTSTRTTPTTVEPGTPEPLPDEPGSAAPAAVATPEPPAPEPAAAPEPPTPEPASPIGVDVTPAAPPEKRRRPWWRPGD